MRIANIRGRVSLVEGSVAVDVERASGGTFNADPAAIYPRWADFSAWAAEYGVADDPDAAPFQERDLGAPSPGARQVFGIGLNYADQDEAATIPGRRRCDCHQHRRDRPTHPAGTATMPTAVLQVVNVNGTRPPAS